MRVIKNGILVVIIARKMDCSVLSLLLLLGSIARKGFAWTAATAFVLIFYKATAGVDDCFIYRPFHVCIKTTTRVLSH